MTQTLFVTTVVASCLVMAPSQPPQATEVAVPVRVSAVELSAVDPTISFNLENTGAKAITAWEVFVSVGDRTTGRSVDAYRGLAGLTQPGSHILPGGTLSVTLPLPFRLTSSSVKPIVTVTGAIFEDKSSVGNAKWIDLVFQSRAGELAAWTEVVAELEKLRAAPILGAGAVEEATALFDVAPRNDGGDSIRKVTRTNLGLVTGDLSIGQAKAFSRLDLLLKLARDSRAAAAAHTL